MRLWDKHLIEALPNRHLKGQWRECCTIAKNISKRGTPGNLLVNRIMDYPISHFIAYAKLISDEMDSREIGHVKGAFTRYFEYVDFELAKDIQFDDIFNKWHNLDYAFICLMNLQEKYECGGITLDEYLKLNEAVRKVYMENE